MAILFDLDLFNVRTLVAAALAEDVGAGDVTVAALLDGEAGLRPVTARIVAKAHGVIAGLGVAEYVYRQDDAGHEFTAHVADGDAVSPGTQVATIVGVGGRLLTLERTAMNFLGHLSGIATLTRKFVEQVKGFSCEICDTRKTVPGMRQLQKYATRMGGATNHRFGLFDAVMLKENHLSAAGVNIGEAVRRCRAAMIARHEPSVTITAEAKNLAEVEAALAAGADIVMLDNFTPERVREAVAHRAALRKADPASAPAVFEASGGITLDTVREFAAAGVERISVGALTHSAPVLDLSCLFDWDATAS